MSDKAYDCDFCGTPLPIDGDEVLCSKCKTAEKNLKDPERRIGPTFGDFFDRLWSGKS